MIGPRPLRIAILGTRGVPARYGGFETFAEELGARLVERGHEVTVYGRDRWVRPNERSHRGIHVVRLPAPRSKYLETVVHALFSAFHVLLRSFDIVYVCNSANLPAALLLRGGGKHVVLNVDGLEWQRAKWGRLGRGYYRSCAWMAARSPIEIVTDALVIQDHYRSAYGRETRHIAYGTDFEPATDIGPLTALGLQPGCYILYVSRLEPENNAHVVVSAFAAVRTDLTLAVVGDAPYADEYVARLTDVTDPRDRFLGGVYREAYRALRSHAAAYVQATEVGGTHPALLEAMGYGNAIVANDVPEHREVLGDAGLYYRGQDDLATKLQQVLDDPELATSLGARALARARAAYGWDAITDAYELWFREMAA